MGILFLQEHPSWSDGSTRVKVLPSDPESQSIELIEQQESSSSWFFFLFFVFFSGGGMPSYDRVEDLVLEIP